MTLFWGRAHKLSQSPRYGLRRRKERTRSEDGVAVGPRLSTAQDRLQMPHVERSHRRRVVLGQTLLVSLTILAGLVTFLRALVAADFVLFAALACAIGFSLLALLSRRSPVPALRIGIGLHSVGALGLMFWGVVHGVDAGAGRIGLAGLYVLGIKLMVLTLFGLMAAAKSADRLRTPESLRTPGTPT